MKIDVIAFARKAGGIASVEKYRQGETDYRFSVEALERFTQLVQQATAAECARICVNVCSAHNSEYVDGYNQAAIDCDEAIRAKFATKEGVQDD